MHRSIRNRRSRRFLVAAGIAMLFASAAISAQERTTLRKVEILGLQRRSPDQVIATTGLKVGDLIEASMIEAAADKLMRSGWFQTVNYRVRNADGGSTVVFEVMEKVAAVNVAAAETLGRVVLDWQRGVNQRGFICRFRFAGRRPCPANKDR
ncbi:MAG: POTRA domain-containing protein [Pyrinomonadaceae bacterium]